MSGQRARQAVVVVHGIGQQRPMSTLSSYVEGLRGPDDLVFAAPTQISEHRDLRRLKVTWLPPIAPAQDGSASLPPVTTDFYELYWANLVVGSEWRHVTSWLFGLLPHWRRLGPRLRRFLRYHVGYAVAVLVLAVVLLVVSVFLPDVFGAVTRIVGGLLVPLATGWLVWHLGDVARYVNNVADNVTIQRAVRREGLELLRRLHDQTYVGSDRPMYDRIVVVGHSLGSVVAYDIVRDYWSEVYRYFGVGPDTPSDLREAADAVDCAGEALWARGGQAETNGGFTQFQRTQRALSARWHELISLPPAEDCAPRWAITDLVTLACPLTHADILLTTGAATVESMQWDRSLATCPPRRQRERPSYRFTYVRGRVGTESWHQAAPFAGTRWTNAYFGPDVVGGPLQQLFGPGVVDVQLTPPPGWLRGRFPMVHTRYDSDGAAQDLVRRVIWDGGLRTDGASLDPARERSLLLAVRELAKLPAEDRTAAATTAPLLRRFTVKERNAAVRLAGQYEVEPSTRHEELLSSAVEQTPTLLTLVTVATAFITWSAAVADADEPEEEAASPDESEVQGPLVNDDEEEEEEEEEEAEEEEPEEEEE